MKWKSFIRRRGWDKAGPRKVWIISGEVTFLWGMTGVYREDSLTSPEQVILDWLVMIPFLEEAETETAVRLSIKFRFGCVILVQVTLFEAF